MDVVTLIQQALEASTKLRELSKKVGDADFKMVLAELHSALADAKLESVDIKMQLAAAQEQILELQQQLHRKEHDKPQVTAEDTYTFEGETGHFCTACWDVHQRKVRLSVMPVDFQFAGKWRCPSCRSNYGGEM
jgi:hypothetical protein